MSSQRYSPEFKEEAARQIVDRGYSVAEVSKRLGVSATGPIDPDDKSYSIQLESGGYEETVSCGAFGATCKRKHFGLTSKTYFLHGEPND